MHQIFQWKFKKTSLIVRNRWNNFCQIIFLIAYVLFGMQNAILTTIPKLIQRKNQKKLKLPGGPKKYKKSKIFCKNILLIGHLETNSAHMTTVLQLFRRNSENFSPKGGIYFKRPTMFSSKCSSGHVKCIFDDSVEKFRQISKNFGTKSKKNLKKNMSSIKTPQKNRGTFKMQFQQKWRNVFSNLICFSLETEVK